MTSAIINGVRRKYKDIDPDIIKAELSRRNIHFENKNKKELFALLTTDDYNNAYEEDRIDSNNRLLVLTENSRFELMNIQTGEMSIFISLNYEYGPIQDFDVLDNERKIVVLYKFHIIIYSGRDGKIIHKKSVAGDLVRMKWLDKDRILVYFTHNLTYNIWNITENLDKVSRSDEYVDTPLTMYIINKDTIMRCLKRHTEIIHLDTGDVETKRYVVSRQLTSRYYIIVSRDIVDYKNDVKLDTDYPTLEYIEDNKFLEYMWRQNEITIFDILTKKPYESFDIVDFEFILYDKDSRKLLYSDKERRDVTSISIDTKEKDYNGIHLIKKDIYDGSYPMKLIKLRNEAIEASKKALNIYVSNNIANLISRFV